MTQTMKIGTIMFLFCFLTFFVLIPVSIEDMPGATGANSARLLPKVITIAWAAVSLLLIITDAITKYVKKATPRTAPGIKWSGLKRVLVVTAAMFLYYFLINILGYIIATMLMLAVFLYIYGNRKIRTIVSVSVVFPILIHFAFSSLMNVSLPKGLIFG